MTQMNVIVLRIRAEQAEEFERLFREEELPIWREYAAEAKFRNAVLSRVEFGTDQRDDVRLYTLVVEVPGMREHAAHDSDPRFEAFLKKARAFQPEPPLVFGGTPIVRQPEAPP